MGREEERREEEQEERKKGVKREVHEQVSGPLRTT
jgi:hypothetical protein